MQPLSVDVEQRRGPGRGASRSSCRSFGLGVLVGGLACAGLAAVALLRTPALGPGHATKFLQGQLPPRQLPNAGSMPGSVGPRPLRSVTIDRAQLEVSQDQAPPQDAARYSRFIPEDDPTFEEPAGGLTYKTPARFLGAEREGAREGSFRIYFTMPGKPGAPRAMDLLPLSRGQPRFGAVTAKLNLGATVKIHPPENYMQVQSVTHGSHAESSGLRAGDIIRGVSLPDGEEAASRWRQVAQSWRQATGASLPLGPVPPPRAEGGVAVLTSAYSADLYFADLHAALLESKAAYGPDAEVVLLVERPN